MHLKIASTFILSQLFQRVYIKDILERHDIRNLDELDELLDIIASAVGSLTNPSKLTHTFGSLKNKKIDPKTLRSYLKYFEEAFLVSAARRYDIKGKKYILLRVLFFCITIYLNIHGKESFFNVFLS